MFLVFKTSDEAWGLRFGVDVFYKIVETVW